VQRIIFQGLKIEKKDPDMANYGLHPCSPDGMPYIGRAGKYNNLILATGYAMLG
jgi:D-amino-acid dehydrogenase